MKKYIYPAVLYSEPENETFTVLFPDLDVVVQGDSAKDCYEKAKGKLHSYFDVATKFSSFIPEPSVYEKVVKNNPKRVVWLMDTEIDEKKLGLSDADQEYKNFLKMFFDEE